MTTLSEGPTAMCAVCLSCVCVCVCVCVCLILLMWYYVFTVLQLTRMSTLVCVHACLSVFLFSPSLPPSFPLCVYYLSLSISLSFSVSLSLSLSLVSSDNVIPHWSDDVMPYPHVIALPISRFCYKFAVLFVLKHSV